LFNFDDVEYVFTDNHRFLQKLRKRQQQNKKQ
jgi:hypothetical protein